MENKVLRIKNKIITIYNKFDRENVELPIIFYNTFNGDALSVWNKSQEIGCNDYIFVVIGNIDWDNEMTPWEELPIFKGDKGYKGLANKHIKFIEDDVIPEVLKNLRCAPKYYAISGYSLGGLFSIYSMLKTNIFSRIISASGSFWYPNFIEYIDKNKIDIKTKKVYLSLGDKEKETKDITKNVEEKTNKLYEILKSNKIHTILEMNKGNHFKEVDLRMAKGIKWILD